MRMRRKSQQSAGNKMVAFLRECSLRPSARLVRRSLGCPCGPSQLRKTKLLSLLRRAVHGSELICLRRFAARGIQ
jgi:hypothetical protein